MAPLPAVAYIRAASRTSSGFTPVDDAVFSGELRSSATNAFHLLYESISQRSAT